MTDLLDLPVELLEEIFRIVLTSPGNITKLSLVCRAFQVRAYDVLLQTPLRFRNQLYLLEWLDGRLQGDLRKIKEVKIQIRDIDFRILLESDELFDQDSPSPRLLTGTLYDAELDTYKQVLKKLPNLNMLTLDALPGQQNDLYYAFLSRLLEGLNSMCPTLEHLCLEGMGHNQSLEFLKHLRHLKSFSYDGFSSMSPTETVSILANLKKLRNLSVVSQQEKGLPSTYHHRESMEKPEFLSHIMDTVTQFTSFSAVERVVPHGSSIIFTPEILDSLSNLMSLKALSIALGHTPDDQILSSLQDFLAKSAIKELELDWPDFAPYVLEKHGIIQEGLEEFRVRARSAMDAFNILWFIYESRKKSWLKELQTVVLIRTAVQYREQSGRVRREDSGVEETQGEAYPVRSSQSPKILVGAFDSLGAYLLTFSIDTLTKSLGQPRSRCHRRGQYLSNEDTPTYHWRPCCVAYGKPMRCYILEKNFAHWPVRQRTLAGPMCRNTKFC